MKVYKFRLYPSAEQEKILIRQLSLCRELYNAFLQQRIYAHKEGKRINYNYQQDQIPELKGGIIDYKNVHSQVLQDVARRMDVAYQNFFRRIMEKKSGKQQKAGFPRFKSRNRYNSITYPQSGFRILDNGHVWLSKIGEIRMFMHRPITGTVRTLSVKRDNVGDWFITVTTDQNTDNVPDAQYGEHHPHDFVNPIGIDLGLKALITTSDSDWIDSPRFLRKSEKKLKRAQRDLSRKVKGSGKREKAGKMVAKIDRKIQRQRNDHAHKVSVDLITGHDLIVFEDLNIEGMKQNHHLAKSIADASWNKLIQYTTYKAESAGREVVLADPRGTSKTCSRCGWKKESLKLSERTFSCDSCGLIIDRDINAAINIRNRGLIKVGRGTPEFTPVEIGALPAMAIPVVEPGSSLL